MLPVRARPLSGCIAAYIARTRSGTVLVTTFGRTLPAALSSLMQRMAPELVDRIEFSGIHAFALSLVRDRGVRRAPMGWFPSVKRGSGSRPRHGR